MRTPRRRGTLAEINVTPLVDVMLVLLVIFMVTAPLLQQGIDIKLPEAKGKPLPTEERIDLSVRKDGLVYLNKTAVSLEEMRAKLRAISGINPQVFLRADRDVPYGLVVGLMAEVKEAGIERLGIVTEPSITLK